MNGRDENSCILLMVGEDSSSTIISVLYEPRDGNWVGLANDFGKLESTQVGDKLLLGKKKQKMQSTLQRRYIDLRGSFDLYVHP